MPYIEDAYERKDDMRRIDYKRRAQLILDKNVPFVSSVIQRGAFESAKTTFGNDKDFPKKVIPGK